LLTGCIIALLLLLLWNSGLFRQIQLRLNDVYFVPSPTDNNIVIVALDDASLSRYGRSLTSWPRSVYAQLIDIIGKGGARVIAFDVLFDDTTDFDTLILETITAARQSANRVRFVMPIIGIAPFSDVSPALSVRFASVLKPARILREAVDYSGYVNTFADVDSTVRRQPSLVEGAGEPGLSFALTAYLAYLRIPPAAIDQVVTPSANSLQVASLNLAVDERGIWLQNFFGPPSTQTQQTFPVYSAQAVNEGEVDPAVFADKLVLIGLMNATGGTDLYAVPSSITGQMMAGVEIHANAIQSLISNKIPFEQSRPSQAIMIVVLSLVASLIYAHLKWYWDLPLAGLMVAAAVVVAFIRFSTRLEVINLFYAILALLVPYVINQIVDIAQEINRRTKAEFLLESVTEISEQEMDIERILPSLKQDIRGLLSARNGAIWLADPKTDKLSLQHQWGTELVILPRLQSLTDRVRQEKRLVQDGLLMAAPIIWQQRIIAIVAVQMSGQRDLFRGNLMQQFTALTQEVAPSLANAILYTETQQQNTLLEAVLSGSPAGIVLLDPNLRLKRTHPAVTKALSLTNNDLLGKSVDDLIGLTGLDAETRNELQQKFSSQRNFRQEIKLGKRVFNLDAARLNFGDWVVILNDITALSELSRLKTQMIRMTSHDLKKPLSRVLGYGSLLLDEQDAPSFNVQQRQYLQRMFHAGEEMLEIINDILNLEQLRSGNINGKLIRIEAVVNEVIERYQPDMELKHQKLTTDFAPELPPISGDHLLLVQALSNLVENAIKYTLDKGCISLRLLTHDTSVRIEVQDTGFGISESAQARLFEEFYRVRTRDTATISGTGLGLSLVKSIVEAHSGRIGVNSQEGVGSTFFIEIPVASQEQES
jgi:signal transduction histidine kinase